MNKTRLVTIAFCLDLLLLYFLASFSLIRPAKTVTYTLASTELVNYYNMNAGEITTYLNLLDGQNITEFIVRLNSYSEWSSGNSSTGIVKAQQIITAADALNISVAIDLHTWYTTWDSYLDDEAPNCATNRANYITYVQNVLNSFSASNVSAFMVMNEPYFRTASASENNFILNVISAAHGVTAKPVSVRFGGGYSPTTGHYAASIDAACDFLCRNTYWDARSPTRTVYGVSESTLITARDRAASLGVELWITEFGRYKSNLEDQRSYIEAFVYWANNKTIDKVFGWCSEPDMNTSPYNLFNGYTPYPAFYELVNIGASPPIPPPAEDVPAEPETSPETGTEEERTPATSSTDDSWVLVNGMMQATVNKTSGWMTSLTYGTFEVIPNMPVAPYHSQVAWELSNGTYWNFWLVNSSSYSSEDAYTSLFLHLHTDATTDTYLNLTYTLFNDRLQYAIILFLNSTGLGNITLRNRLGTDYADWDSIIPFGGNGAYREIGQFNSTDNELNSFTYGYETIAHAFARPMVYPLVVFVRTDLEMNLYCADFFKHSYFTLWDYSSGHLFRTDFGVSLEDPPANYQLSRTFTLQFNAIDADHNWLDGVKNYHRSVINDYGLSPLQIKDDVLEASNLYDIHPADWYNTTRLNAAKTLGVKALWLYGWQSIDESYPITGTWTTASDSIAVNATFMKQTIANLTAQGFRVYLYFRDWTDYNVSVLTHPLWLNKVNASANGYYFGWALPGNHISVRWAFSNSSFQDYYYQMIFNVTNYYQPYGLALDWGGTGSLSSDIVDYGSGDHFFGVFNLTKRLYESDFHIMNNGGITGAAWFSEGMLFEDPGYNNWIFLEPYLAPRLFNTTGFLLTTGHTPSDQSDSGETMWTYYALAAGINRGWDYNFVDLTSNITTANIKSMYDVFWARSAAPLLMSRYPVQDNFRLGNNTFVGYFTIPSNDKSNLWLLIFNNASFVNLPVQTWSYSNRDYLVTSIYYADYLELANVTDTYTLSGLSFPFDDRYLVDNVSTSFIDLYTMLGMGVAGIAMMVISPSWIAIKIKNDGIDEETVERMAYAFLLFLFGFGLTIVWLWA